MKEIWKSVVGFEGIYEVSSKGRVKSLNRVKIQSNGTTRRFKGQVLKQRKNRCGYFEVGLHDQDAKQIFCLVHRLVGIAFIPNKESKPCINHKDFIRTNNTPKNLEWVTVSENIAYSVRAGNLNRNSSKKVTSINIKTGERRDFVSFSSASRELGISKHIYRFLNGELARVGNFKFILNG